MYEQDRLSIVDMSKDWPEFYRKLVPSKAYKKGVGCLYWTIKLPNQSLEKLEFN